MPNIQRIDADTINAIAIMACHFGVADGHGPKAIAQSLRVAENDALKAIHGEFNLKRLGSDSRKYQEIPRVLEVSRIWGWGGFYCLGLRLFNLLKVNDSYSSRLLKKLLQDTRIEKGMTAGFFDSGRHLDTISYQDLMREVSRAESEIVSAISDRAIAILFKQENRPMKESVLKQECVRTIQYPSSAVLHYFPIVLGDDDRFLLDDEAKEWRLISRETRATKEAIREKGLEIIEAHKKVQSLKDALRKEESALFLLGTELRAIKPDPVNIDGYRISRKADGAVKVKPESTY